MPVIIEFSRCIGTYSSAKFEYNIYIMCIKVLSGSEETGTVNSIIDGIKYAERMGANICCLSLASPYINSVELKKTIENSHMLFTVAAGNYGFELGNSYKVYPACYLSENMITVADIRCDGRLSHTSNYGYQFVDIAAPGSDIVGMLPNGNYVYLSGTSSATAIVAAGAAIVRNLNSNDLTSSELKKALVSSAHKMESLKGYVRFEGFLDIYNAID